MFEDINEIMELSRENGYKFFDKKRLQSTGTTVLPTLYGGKYFITQGLFRGSAIYSIYGALRDGAVDIVRANMFLSKRSAERFLKLAILPDVYEEEESNEL